MSSSSEQYNLAQVLQHPAVWRARDTHHQAGLPFGYSTLDQQLPNGWAPHAINEILVPQYGVGEFALLLPVIRQLQQSALPMVWIDPPALPYAPGLLQRGIELNNLLIIRPNNDREAIWAAEQGLRAGALSGMVLWNDETSMRRLRRLQLAAEHGKTWLALIRKGFAAKLPSPAPLRLEIQTKAESRTINIIKSRGLAGHTQISFPPLHH